LCFLYVSFYLNGWSEIWGVSYSALLGKIKAERAAMKPKKKARVKKVKV
jgi:hypothetical protein